MYYLSTCISAIHPATLHKIDKITCTWYDHITMFGDF